MKKTLLILTTIITLLIIVSFLPCQPCDKPRTVSVTISADIPKENAWQLLQDFSLPHNYVPGLAKTVIVSEVNRGLGAHREVHNVDGSFIEETIVQWNEGSGFLINLHKDDQVMPPFKVAQFRYQLDDDAESRSRITLSMITQLPMGYVGLLLQDWLLDRIIADQLKGVAAGMALFYQSGKPVDIAEREALKKLVKVI